MGAPIVRFSGILVAVWAGRVFDAAPVPTPQVVSRAEAANIFRLLLGISKAVLLFRLMRPSVAVSPIHFAIVKVCARVVACTLAGRTLPLLELLVRHAVGRVNI